MRSSAAFILFATAAIAAPILDTSALPVDTSSITDLTDGLSLDEVTELLPVGLPSLPVRGLIPEIPAIPEIPDLSTLTDLTSDLPIALPSLPVRGLVPEIPDLSELTDLTKDLPVALPSLPVRGLIPEVPDLSSLTDLTSDLPVSLPSLPVRGLIPEVPEVPEIPDISSLTSDLPVALPSLPIRKRLSLSSTIATLTGLLTDVLGLTNKAEANVSSLIHHLESLNLEGVLSDTYSLLTEVAAEVQKITSAQGVKLPLATAQPTLDNVTGQLNKIVAELSELANEGVVSNLIVEIESLVDDILRLIENVVADNLS